MPMMTVDELRSKLGVPESKYKTMSNFKLRVLDFAVKQINEYSDLKLSYRQHKNGRTIEGFTFIFKSKNPTVTITQSDDDDDFFDNFHMTEAQINVFASKIANLPSAQKEANQYTIKTHADFIDFIKSEILVEPKKWWPYLLEAGYSKKYLAKKDK